MDYDVVIGQNLTTICLYMICLMIHIVANYMLSTIRKNVDMLNVSMKYAFKSYSIT